jgi:hypothetical protein
MWYKRLHNIVSYQAAKMLHQQLSSILAFNICDLEVGIKNTFSY